MKIQARARLFGIWLAGVILGMLIIAGIGVAKAAEEAPARTEEAFVYDISFLFFRNAAEGSLTLRYLPEQDLYEGVVRAKTKGFTGLLSLLGAMWWNSTVETGGETTREIKTHPIPEGAVYEDFISAFFNLRRGVYGPIEPGRRYTLLALPTRQAFKKGGNKTQTFSVKVGRTKAGGVPRTVVSINVPKDLFGQRVGNIQFHLGENLVPSRVLVENVLLFGDMKGKLRTHRVAARGQLTAQLP